METYGFTIVNVSYDFNQIRPDWFDVARPTKSPACENEYGTGGNVHFPVGRQDWVSKIISPLRRVS